MWSAVVLSDGREQLVAVHAGIRLEMFDPGILNNFRLFRGVDRVVTHTLGDGIENIVAADHRYSPFGL